MAPHRVALVLIACGVAGPAAAQVTRPARQAHHMKLLLDELAKPQASPSASASPSTPAAPGTLHPVLTLTRHLTDGSLDKLAGYAVELLKTAAKKDPQAAAALGPIEESHYGIVWVGDRDGKEQVLRVTVDGNSPPRVVSRLPGVRLARDVFFSASEGARLRSVYTATRVADPVSALLPDALQRWNIIGFLGRSLGPGRDQASAVFLQINHAELPFERAEIAIHDTAVIRKDLGAFIREVDDLRQSVQLREARLSPCARSLSDRLAEAIKDEARTCATLLDRCTRDAEQQRGGVTKEEADEACRVISSACVKRMLEAEAAAYDQAVAACLPETVSGPDPVPAVEARFRDLVRSGGAKSLVADSKVPNTPLTRVTLGLISALRVGRTTLGQERVAVQSGKIAAVPFDRAMTMVTVNFHPAGFDSGSPVMTGGERFRIFAAGVMTPDFGVAGGIGLGLLKGISINAGGAVLMADTLRDGEQLGAAPAGTDPFRTRPAFTGFVGLGFAFK